MSDEANEMKSPQDDMQDTEAIKIASIISACRTQDIPSLIHRASTTGGFINDDLRQQAWPLLLGSSTTSQATQEWKDLPRHKDEDQVALDVNRSFIYYPSDPPPSDLSDLKSSLSDLITQTLRLHPSLNYFQGYHDIAQVLLLALGPTLSAPALARLSLLRIRDFMLPSLSSTTTHLDLIPPILFAADEELCRHLAGLQPFFALAATLTLFAHEIESYGSIARIFDYLLASPAVAAVYMFAVIVMLRRDELMEIETTEPEMLYAVLSKLPKGLDVEVLVRRAEELRAKFPPEKLPWKAWRKVSAVSVLKTTQDVGGVREQTLQMGERWLGLLTVEVETAERRKKMVADLKKRAVRYRRPAGAVTLAVLVGVVSLWLGRNGGLSTSGVLGALGWARHRLWSTMYQLLGQWRP
ncbi:hypothetical protein MBLNU457_g2448t1 [Dothideomycetes sp. NU457]